MSRTDPRRGQESGPCTSGPTSGKKGNDMKTKWRSITPLGIGACAALATPALAQSGDGSAEKAFPQDWVERFEWREIGPANMGGRITDFAVYNDDPSTYYVGTASGGLLKTTDNGVSFEHQFTDQGASAIGDIAVSQQNPDLIWVGTGEDNPRNSSSFGDGVYKSADGGETFGHMGLEGSFQTGKILIHPEDDDTVFVGALGRLWGPNEQRGVFKSTDGGETWDNVLYVDENTGAIDVVMHPDDPDVMLAAMWERRRDEFDTNDPWRRWGPGSGVYRSTDGGENWNKITSGLPSVEMGRIGLWWSRYDTDVVFTVVDTERAGMGIENAGWLGVRTFDRGVDLGTRVFRVDDDSPAAEAGLERGDTIVAVGGEVVTDNDDFLRLTATRLEGETVEMVVVRDDEKIEKEITLGENPDPDARPFATRIDGQQANIGDLQGPDGYQTGGVFRSDDAGRSWERINSNNPRSMYYSNIIQDHNDPDFLWMHGTRLWRSVDGGETWTSDATPGEVHVDHHAFWINPEDGDHLLLGNDGGIYVTYDKGEKFDHLNHVGLAQFYHVQVDNRPLYNVYAGLQDNGTWGGPNRTRSNEGPRNSDWFRVGGGDGFIVMVNPDDPDHVYGASQNGNVYSVNFRTGERRSLRPRAERGEDDYRWNWKTPFLLSHHNGGIFYSAGSHVFRSLDEGGDMDNISPVITRTRRGAATALDESPLNSDHLMVGTDDGSLWVTRDAGANWENVVFPYDPDAFSDDNEDGPRASQNAAATDAQRNGSTNGSANGSANGAAYGSNGTSSIVDAELTSAGPASDAQPEQEQEGSNRIEMMLRRMDKNRDGKLQKSEVPERMQWIFPLLDKNEDGELTKKELEQGAEQLRRRAGRAMQSGEESGQSEQATQRERRMRRRAAQAEAQQTSQEETQPDTESQPAETDPDDPILGTWILEFEGGQGVGEIFVEMARDEEGELNASTDAAFIQGGAESPVNYDAETGEFSLDIEAGFGVMGVAGTLEGDEITGEINAPEVGFSAAFSGYREGARREATEGDPLGSMIPGPRRVQSVEWSKFAEQRVYVVLDGHYYDDDNPYVFVSEDAGRTWRDLTANLPTVTTRVLREDLENPDLLYLGTEFGFYISIDRGETWTRFHNNLPSNAVHDVAQHEFMGEIVLGTHGRGAWALDVTPLRQMTEPARLADVYLYQPNKVYRWRNRPSRGEGTRDFSGENPDDNAHIYYSFNNNVDDATLEIQDARGRTVATLDAETDGGLHHAEWNLRRESDNNFGPLVEPGTYRVVMTAGEYTITRTLEVENDPEMGDTVFATDSFFSTESFGDVEEGPEGDGYIDR